MLKRLLALGTIGLLPLTGCAGEAQSEQTTKPCFEDEDVVQLQYDWGYLVAGPRAYASAGELSDKAWTYAQQVEELAYTVEDDRQCTGKRESLELTLKALELFKAIGESSSTEADYEETAAAGEALMKVMDLQKHGYSKKQVTFKTTIDDPEKHDGRVSDEPCFSVDEVGDGITHYWNRAVKSSNVEQTQDYLLQMLDAGDTLYDSVEIDSYPICAGYGEVAEINESVAELNLDVLNGSDTDGKYREIAEAGNKLLKVSDARKQDQDYRFIAGGHEQS